MSAIPVGVGYSQKLVIAGRDDFHHVDPWSMDHVVRGLHVDHIRPVMTLYGSAWIGKAIVLRERVSFLSNSYKFVWVCGQILVQGAFVQDADTAPTVD